MPKIWSWIVQVTPKDLMIKYHTEGSACWIENVRLDRLKTGLKESFYDYEQNSVANSSHMVRWTKLGLNHAKYFNRCIDVIYKRWSESDDSIIHTKT